MTDKQKKKISKNTEKLVGLIIVLFLGPAIIVKAWNGHLTNFVNELPVLTYWSTFLMLWAVGVIGGRIFKRVK